MTAIAFDADVVAPTASTTVVSNAEFLRAVYGSLGSGEHGWVTAFSISPDKAEGRDWAGSAVASCADVRDYTHGNAYFSVSTVKFVDGATRRKAENLSRMCCVVVDDPESDVSCSWRLQTSAHKYQVGFLLAECITDHGIAQRLQKELGRQKLVPADKNGYNPVRYVRLPNGINNKHGAPFRCQLVEWNPDLLFTVDELIALFKLNRNFICNAAAANSTSTHEGPRADDSELVRAIVTGDGYHDQIRTLSARYVHRKLGYKTIVGIIEGMMNAKAPEQRDERWKSRYDDIGRTVKGAIDEFGTPAPIVVTELPGVTPHSETTFPAHLLYPPGLVGDIARYLNATAIRPQPVLELAASIALCGTLMGRKVRTPSDLRTNVYIVGVADSGAGKEHARKSIKHIMAQAGILRMLGAERLASDAGLFGAVHLSPSCLLLLDEIGRVLRTVTSPRAPAHLVNIATMLMELTGSADTIYLEKKRAEHSEVPAKIIQQPNVCVYGTTVPGRLYSALTEADITDGFLPRLLTFISDDPDPEIRPAVDKQVPNAILDAVLAWASCPVNPNGTGNLAELMPAPKVVPINHMAQERFNALEAIAREQRKRTRGTGLDAMWARAQEHALRLALIRAAGIEFDSPVIDEADAEWACAVVEHLLHRAISEIGQKVAENPYESQLKKVAAFIRSKGRVAQTDITRHFRSITQRERTDILAALQEAGDIVLATRQTGGRAENVYQWVAGKEG